MERENTVSQYSGQNPQGMSQEQVHNSTQAPVAQQRPMSAQQAMPQQRPMSAQQAMPQQRPMSAQHAMPGQRPMSAQQAMPQQRPVSAQQAMPQQRPMSAQQPMPGQRPMSPPQTQAQASAQDTQRQAVVRLFEPDMHELKQIIRTVNEYPNTKTSLYGQSGEVLLAIQTPGLNGSDASMHANKIAKQIESTMGVCAYGRDRDSLALCAVELLNDNGYKIAAPDEETGRLLEHELGSIESSHDIFDFGEKSYYSSRMADKILDAAILDDEESSDAAQLASDRSFAAKKIMKTTFGVAIETSEDGEEIGVAVTYGKLVYIRRIQQSQTASKTAVLTLLDMLRRLCDGLIIPYANAFHAGDEVDWDDPLKQKGGTERKKQTSSSVSSNSKAKKSSSKSSKKGGLVIPIIVLSLVAVALVLGMFYIYNIFIIENDDVLAVGTGDATTQTTDGESVPTEAPIPEDTQQGEASGNNSEAVVHPFG